MSGYEMDGQAYTMISDITTPGAVLIGQRYVLARYSSDGTKETLIGSGNAG